MTPDERENRDANIFFFGIVVVCLSVIIVGVTWSVATSNWTNLWPSLIGVIGLGAIVWAG